jgi:lysophospholipase L1-like esterase
VSCTPAGGCSAGGYYTNASGWRHAFVVSEVISLAALGDSYSSGEGAGSYYPGTSSAKGCHRSPNAWPVLLQKGVADHDVVFPQASFLACSGAPSTALTAAFKGQQPQLAALKKLPRKPTLITMTIGGNDPDVGFANVLKDCYTGNCVTDGTLKAIEGKLPEEKAILERDYRGLKTADPAATILIVGYPKIFEQVSWCEGITNSPWGFSPKEEVALNTLTGKFDAIIASAAAADGVKYVNVAGALAGHELCTKNSRVNAVGVLKNFFGNSQEQGHPTAAGQTAIAKIVAGYLHSKGISP